MKKKENFITTCCDKVVSMEEAILNHGLCDNCMDKAVEESNERMMNNVNN